jgi:hypothetical protein
MRVENNNGRPRFPTQAAKTKRVAMNALKHGEMSASAVALKKLSKETIQKLKTKR